MNEKCCSKLYMVHALPKLDQCSYTSGRYYTSCQSVKENSSVAPLRSWVWPAKPWQGIHVDFAGPFMGKMFFIIVDTHSKWPEVANANDFYLNRLNYQCFTSNVCFILSPTTSGHGIRQWSTIYVYQMNYAS